MPTRGQILLGLDRPGVRYVSHPSSNAHDILGVAAIVGVQSIEYREALSRRGVEPAGRVIVSALIRLWPASFNPA